MRNARKALLHAKNLPPHHGECRSRSAACRTRSRDFTLTLAVHNAEFLHTLEAVIVQAHESLGASGEPEQPSDN